MKLHLRVGFGLLILFLVLTAGIVPARGNGHEKGHGHGQSKKESKFVNGHDARDGKWDGTGPKPGKKHKKSSSRHHKHHRSTSKHKH